MQEWFDRPKYLRFTSDIHLDFDISSNLFNFGNKFNQLWFPEVLATDLDTALILAGDIWHARKPFDFQGKSWLKKLSQQFQYIIIVLGNHDFWNGDINLEYAYYRKQIAEQELSNVFLLQNSTLFFNNLKIIGATLWTDYLEEQIFHMKNAIVTGMKDYHYISDGTQKLTPDKILKEHKQSKQYIYNNSKNKTENEKIIVVTHHSPSYLSAIKDFNKIEFQIYKGLYHSNLDSFIKKSAIDLWIHGHSHLSVDYHIGNTRIMANPRGYPGENTGYNPWIVFDLNTFHLCDI